MTTTYRSLKGREMRVAQGAALRALRVTRGLTQEDLGKAVGMSPKAIAATESGAMSFPDTIEQQQDLPSNVH